MQTAAPPAVPIAIEAFAVALLGAGLLTRPPAGPITMIANSLLAVASSSTAGRPMLLASRLLVASGSATAARSHGRRDRPPVPAGKAS